ncbi:hypothetical protein SAMN06265348_11781 [Pedobacter westerhofensis]|uniref:Alpha-galactosidase n=1 Tax=Pedobacter westerhofensis TaxID=425512 RepID=A0A521FRG5_9SPHI|nr:alpha-galactosidase [Pedobacter westerhofensis]SMO98696.1 hypothetical protein SAMN06265348_11781 [Pedobacter westerhofensis]
MKKILTILLMCIAQIAFAQTAISSLPIWRDEQANMPEDWLLDNGKYVAEVYRSKNSKDIILDNGLLRRSFRIKPNLACIDFQNKRNGEQLVRAVSPEAKITINGKNYKIGGLDGQKERAYLKPEWLDHLVSNKDDFQFKSYIINALDSYVKWKPSTQLWASNKHQAKGKMLTLIFESAKADLKGITVKVNYELYDNIPLICKWLTIENSGTMPFEVNAVINEILAVPEEESAVAGTTVQFKKPHGLYIESNYAFNNSMTAQLSDQTTHWKTDSAFTSQVSYSLLTPCVLEVYPPFGPAVVVKPGNVFKSIRTNELLMDGYDRERNGLSKRRMYRAIAPWTTQNPIFMHLISTDPRKVRDAVDQCATTGYEGIILSFGSGINMEDVSDENIRTYKELAEYAHKKGILFGGYSLFSSRKINDDEDVIDPKTGKADVHALFGHAPCLASNWGLQYLDHLKEFMTRTGFDIFENDGPYAGDVCASKKHPGHTGLEDSQWAQMELQKAFYRWCSERSIYTNVPDWYFLDGSNKIALGYRERNFSLPREQQVILNRQNIYDGTWEKTPSMSWGFVPLTEYQGGGAAATIEPLSDHLDVYEQLMMQYYGAGIQACYRGPRLYDTEATKAVVSKVIRWYKTYRDILNADVIHLRRPDGRDWDGILHVSTNGAHRGLAMLYNPTSAAITRSIKLPLYYTDLKRTAVIRDKERPGRSYPIDVTGNVYYTVDIPAKGYTWLVIE